MRRWTGWSALVLLGVALEAPLRAHEGPPFPIVMDKKAGPYVVSVWTDPDVGTGTFFVILESADEGKLSEDIEVEVCVRPVTERLPEACYQAALQRSHKGTQYYAEVEFDRQEMWAVRVRVSSPEGSAEVRAEVEATPPGYGPWDLLIYGFPFLLFGSLWVFAVLRRRSSPAEPCPPAPLPTGSRQGEVPPGNAGGV